MASWQPCIVSRSPSAGCCRPARTEPSPRPAIPLLAQCPLVCQCQGVAGGAKEIGLALNRALTATSSPVRLFFPRLTTEKPAYFRCSGSLAAQSLARSEERGYRTSDTKDLTDLKAFQELLHSCCTAHSTVRRCTGRMTHPSADHGPDVAAAAAIAAATITTDHAVRPSPC